DAAGAGIRHRRVTGVLTCALPIFRVLPHRRRRPFHVVAGTDRGSAVFVDAAEREFRVVGRDPLSDLAVVRVDGSVEAATLGDAELGGAERGDSVSAWVGGRVGGYL